jgi:hypothetical protein
MTDFLPRYGRRNPYFEALLKEGTNTSPIGAHSQGLSRLAFALLAGLERNAMERGGIDAQPKIPLQKGPPVLPTQGWPPIIPDNKWR